MKHLRNNVVNCMYKSEVVNNLPLSNPFVPQSPNSPHHLLLCIRKAGAVVVVSSRNSRTSTPREADTVQPGSLQYSYQPAAVLQSPGLQHT